MNLHSLSVKDGIFKLTQPQRALLFAELSAIAYMNLKPAKKHARALGFTQTEFYDRDGAQAYRFQNKTDCVIVCRGTEPTCFNDIRADLNAIPAVAETVSRVHRGFKSEVDDLWPMVVEDVAALGKQKLWFAGHSLGAAMTTIMASRCLHDRSLTDPEEVYTYGSPRVGWPSYVRSLGCMHHRYVNNNDIVCRVPLVIMGYRHHGKEHYINAYGNLRKHTGWQRVKDRWRGIWLGLKQGRIDNFSDHNMSEYIRNLARNI